MKKIFTCCIFFWCISFSIDTYLEEIRTYINSQYLCGKFYEKVTKSIGRHTWREFPMATESRILQTFLSPSSLHGGGPKTFYYCTFPRIGCCYCVGSEDGRIADKMNRKSRSKRPFRNQFALNIQYFDFGGSDKRNLAILSLEER